MTLRPPVPGERTALLDLAVRTGLFRPEEAEALLGTVLDAAAAGELPPGHQLACCPADAEGRLQGWCYFAPDTHADGVWNLWWIGVDPVRHGQGVGAALLAHVEREVQRAGGRLLVIETSDAPALARARRFYAARGYQACGAVPHFYGEGEAKCIFARHLAGAAAAAVP